VREAILESLALVESSNTPGDRTEPSPMNFAQIPDPQNQEQRKNYYLKLLTFRVVCYKVIDNLLIALFQVQEY
jgi:hypothetical protein